LVQRQDEYGQGNEAYDHKKEEEKQPKTGAALPSFATTSSDLVHARRLGVA
jgi:hypothetical protein